jgi:hypothetical protein
MRFLILAICLLIGSSAIGQSNLRSQVVATYQTQLGVREATGKNDGPEVEKYLSSVGLGKGYSWCGAFVYWCLLQNEIKGPKGAAWAPVWGVSASQVWKNAQSYTRLPMAGDVFTIYYPHLKRIGHVGFVHQYKGNTIVTVEGNTNAAGSREGDGVYKKVRIARQIYSINNHIHETG